MEMIIAAGLWFVMIAGISQVIIQSKRQQKVTETQDVGQLFAVTLQKYFAHVDNCRNTFTLPAPGMAIDYGTKRNLTIPNFPFKTIAGGDTLTLTAGAKLLGDQLTLRSLTIELKFPNAESTPSVIGAVPVWFKNRAHWRNAAVINAGYDIRVGDLVKTNLSKTVEVPIIVDPAIGRVASCTEEATIEDACTVIFSSQSGTSPNCNPVRVEFKGTYHTREIIGAPVTVACPSPVTRAPNTSLPGYCAPGTFWCKDLPTGTPDQCIPQGACPPGKGEFAGNCYPVALPQGNCPAGQGEYMGTCMNSAVIDQATYVCTCPDTGAVVNCGQPPGVAMAPCADANTMTVDPVSGAYLCACPPGATEFLSGQHDWTQTTSVICGWSGYGKKVGPSYCPVNTGMRDKFYVCIKTS